MKRILLTFFGTMLLTHLASASIILNLVGNAPTAGTGAQAGDFVWTYDVTLSSDQNVQDNDYTEIVDFSLPSAIVSVSYNTAGSQLSASQVSLTTPLTKSGATLPPGNVDSPSLENIVATFQNISTSGNPAVGIAGNGSLGDIGQIVVVSTLGSIASSGGNFTGSFSSLADKNSDGSATFNQGYLPTPGASPEPATLSLMGAGLLLAGALSRRRSKKG